MINPTDKNWIDTASYDCMLARQRYSPGDPIFDGESGDYFATIINRKMSKLAIHELLAISKAIGFP
jgi:hypothetical protein